MKIYLSIMVLALLMGCQSTKNMGSTDKKATDDRAAEKISHDLSMYPEATAELQRQIIVLPEKENEADYKIELYAGKTMEVDCNRHTLSGALLEKSVSGWGYPYYEFDTNHMVMSTRMACPEDSLHEEFVQSGAILIRYNSKLPMVIYTPQGYTIKYRIWHRDGTEHMATKA